MASSTSTVTNLAELFAASHRPIYAVDAGRQVVYCNAALASWLGLDTERIIGRYVEYHSESSADEVASRQETGPLAGLCPPPRTLAGRQSVGTVGCVGRDGRLLHRHADFIPLGSGDKSSDPFESTASGNGLAASAVLVVLATEDLSAEALSAELSTEPTSDELHRAIRRFHRGQAGRYATDLLLGESAPMRRVRAQVAAVAASQANVLVRGRPGSGRSHIARAIHYHGPADDVGQLVPIDCEVASEDLLRRAIDSLRGDHPKSQHSSLLAVNLERLRPELQSQLLSAIQNTPARVRFIATMSTPSTSPNQETSADAMPAVMPDLIEALSTIAIDVPRLVDRLEDLPLAAQSFLEAANVGAAKQIGSLQPEALDLLALYCWPGELDELRNVIAAAHAACRADEITPADLPDVIHHAVQAAALPRRATEKVVLDDLLASMERELITRAMRQANGNKSAAAELLGLTRPRLYRRLVQLGMIEESPTTND